MKERDIVNHRNRSRKCFNQREITIEYIEVWDKVIIDIGLEKCFDQWEITLEYIEVLYNWESVILYRYDKSALL